MSAGVIDRPEIGYDDPSHTYTLDGVVVPGISSVAKMGDDSWGAASWWGWGIALDGICEVFEGGHIPVDVQQLRGALRDAGWDPNRKRDRASDRGNAVHDAFEKLVQKGTVPDPNRYPEEEAGHVLSLLRWFLHYRPEFEASELIVASRTHHFAGRYDLRCLLPLELLPGVEPHEVRHLKDGRQAALCLVDLKTSKWVYPESHFPQLAGYELASVEMGFAPTDAQFILRTSPDGSFVPFATREPHKWIEENFARSWSTGDEFLGYLEAYLAVERLHDRDPKVIRQREEDARRRREEQAVYTLLEAVSELGATARELTDELACEWWDGKTTSRVLQRLKAQKRVACKGRTWRVIV